MISYLSGSIFACHLLLLYFAFLDFLLFFAFAFYFRFLLFYCYPFILTLHLPLPAFTSSTFFM